MLLAIERKDPKRGRERDKKIEVKSTHLTVIVCANLRGSQIEKSFSLALRCFWVVPPSDSQSNLY